MSIEQKLLKHIEKEQLKKKQIETQGKRKIEPNLKRLSDGLDEYYYYTKLKTYCAYLSYTQIIRPSRLDYQLEDFKLIEIIIKEINLEQFKHPAIKIYNKIRLLFESLSKENISYDTLYQETHQLVNNHLQLFKIEEKLELYSFLSNFCVRKFNEGDKKYLEKHFLLNNEIVNLKYYRKRSAKEFLPASLFKNMVTVGVFLHQESIFHSMRTLGLNPNNKGGFKNGFEWANQFIDFYQKKLDKAVRQIYVNYCKAYISFHSGEYLNAYDALKNPNYIQGIIFNLDVKLLHLKILYEVNLLPKNSLEKDEIDLKKILESFRGLIRDEATRKQQLIYQLPYFKNFEQLYRKLLILYENYDGKFGNSKNVKFLKKKSLLSEEIAKIHYSYKGWLSSKVNQIN